MDIDVFPTPELPTVFRVLRTALRAEGPLDTRERLFLDTYARIVGLPPLAQDPAPIAAPAVAIAGAHPRKRLLQLAALAVLLGRPVRRESLEFLTALAGQLAVHDPVLGLIDAVVRGRLLKARLLAMRRGMRVLLKEAWLAQGAMGVVRLFAALWFKAPVNRGKLWRYRRLGLLPEGTLGREYWKFMTCEGFPFPGDVAGIPDTVAYHDVAHVLAGHEATPPGEIQQGSFQAGNRREDGFFFLQMVILQFHQGVRVTPATGPQTDLFDPEKVLWAIHRGARCRVDMTHQWNYWPLMELPLDEARRRCGLLPRLDTIAAAA
ncbi:MAG: hypothetical protein JNL87_18880 [Burkholderiaceae bacterium]|nr:hypothetical protein [Burkholderiaceae bacterium]